MNQTPPSLPDPDFYELIYVSVLADAAGINAVPDIARQSRGNNPVHGITGLLVFDGDRFCQQIEGRRRAVVELFERISNDARHDHVSLLHQGTIMQRRYRQFNIGYPLLEAGDTLANIEALRGEAAISAFQALATAVHMI
ncbi:MAG: BLUF domain-containing protein [Pseudomonadota bacterium]